MTYALTDSLTMLRRNLLHVKRYPIVLFVVAILAVEAAGIASAALLPGEPPGTGGDLLRGVVAFYGASSFAIWLAARGARVGRAPRQGGDPRHISLPGP